MTSNKSNIKPRLIASSTAKQSFRSTPQMNIVWPHPSPLRGGWPREAGSGGGPRHLAKDSETPTRRATRATLPARGRDLRPAELNNG